MTKSGIKVNIVWECEYDKKYKQDSDFRAFVNQMEIISLLRPGDALYGGRNEVFTLFKKASIQENIKYVDFCSLYPAVMSQEKYPLRFPTKIQLNPDCETIVKSFGLAK